MAQKRKAKPRGQKVVRLETKRAEKTVEQLGSLMEEIARGTDEAVALIVDHYHEWERENPEAAVSQLDKMTMVRLGFIGPGGFSRCHEPGRRPTEAYISKDGDLADEVLDDYLGSESLMCPAMESRTCQGVWSAIGVPPCHLLLLEVHAGLGGGVYDERVGEILHDYGKGERPEAFAKSFADAERLLRRYRPK